MESEVEYRLRTLEDRIQGISMDVKLMGERAVVFRCKCGRCKGETAHRSLMGIPNMMPYLSTEEQYASTTQVGVRVRKIKVCLACGEVT